MTETSIANMALSRIGAQSIAFGDGSRNATSVNRVYDHARDEMLRLLPWPALLKRAYLTDADDCEWEGSTTYSVGDFVTNDSNIYVCITAGTSAATGGPTGESTYAISDGTVEWRWENVLGTNLTGYSYRYLYPYDCMRIEAILNTSDGDVEYRAEKVFIYTDTEDAIAQYVNKEENPDKWDEYLRSLVIRRLAMEVCFELTQDRELLRDVTQEFYVMAAEARRTSLPERFSRPKAEAWWGTGI